MVRAAQMELAKLGVTNLLAYLLGLAWLELKQTAPDFDQLAALRKSMSCKYCTIGVGSRLRLGQPRC